MSDSQPAAAAGLSVSPTAGADGRRKGALAELVDMLSAPGGQIEAQLILSIAYEMGRGDGIRELSERLAAARAARMDER